MKKISSRLLSSSNESPNHSSNESFFCNPLRGQLDYYSFSDFNNKDELAKILEQYLSDFNLKDKDYKTLSKIAFDLNKERKKSKEDGDLSEFVYVMH